MDKERQYAMSYVIDGDYGEPIDMGPPDGEPIAPDETEPFPSILQSAEDERRKRLNRINDLNAKATVKTNAK